MFFYVDAKVSEIITATFCVDVYRQDKKYSQGKLVDCENEEIDSAFPIGKIQVVTYQTKTVIKSGKVGLYVGFCGITGETYTISNLQISDKTQLSYPIFGGDITLYQFEQNYAQSMGFCFVTKNKKLILIDGGAVADTQSIYNFILENGGVVDGWFLTHYHDDHVGALCSILSKEDCKIKIKNLYYNFPNYNDLNGTEDADNRYVKLISEIIENKKDIVLNVDGKIKKSDEFIIDDIKIKVLNDAYFGTFNFVNNSSVVFKVETPKEHVLFFGDLAQRGEELLKDEYFLSEMKTCTIVQTAHHGQDGVSDRVYQSLDKIKVCLYCAAGWLFDCDVGEGVGSGIWETLHTRELMRTLGVIKTFNSKRGRVVIK
jgi:hypothetical protein